jgi:GntR family transcriptional regulator
MQNLNILESAPLHARIEHALQEMLMLPQYQNGAMFPDELTLANRFGVSRGTVRVALARLVDRRLLERKRGVGTRVMPAPTESSITEWRSFSQEMAARNIQVECFYQDVRRLPATAKVAAALQIEKGSQVLRLDRVRGWENQPVMHSRSWLHPRLLMDKEADFSRPLYELLEQKTGVVVDSAYEEFTALAASSAMARRLKIDAGQPLLLRRHTVYDAGKRPVEFAEVHYISSRFTLTLNLKRSFA